ncbi:MAG: phosphotransferase family protein [Deltaproteobacteria bacterium]|nr:phosphotransferase family protein [Deltaproteobacteria bacterium]MBW2363173.1 phosphotransferase family protein [Deltaproteobacteria bacterium]
MRPPPEIEIPPLERWLDEHLGDRMPIEVAALKGGGSCELFSLRRGGERWVLRRAPARASSSTAHDVLREHRILQAIREQDVRIAKPIIACDDPAVAGAPFYVMEFVDGEPIRHKLPAAYADSREAQGLALTELIDALAEVHNIDWRACGLESLGKPEGYLERQVPRWLAQLDSYRCRELPGVDATGHWLRENLPAEQPAALAHGDYKLDNLLYSRELPARALAVVDWEMASIGDPLVDLAWALIFLPEEGNTLALGAAGQPGGFQLAGLPTQADLVERYAERTGRDLGALHWYRVFSPWKLGIVLEGSYAKHLRGESKNPNHAFFGNVADTLLARAESLAQGGRG